MGATADSRITTNTKQTIAEAYRCNVPRSTNTLSSLDRSMLSSSKKGHLKGQSSADYSIRQNTIASNVLSIHHPRHVEEELNNSTEHRGSLHYSYAPQTLGSAERAFRSGSQHE